MTNSINTATIEQLRNGAQALDVALTDGQVDLFCRFLDQLQIYNEHTNLVANADAAAVIPNHILDSIALVPIIQRLRGSGSPIKLVDIGSGAGFPGLALALAIPDLHVMLIDSIGKKTRFLSEVAATLGLSNRIIVHNGRAEDLPHERRYREAFNFATARAVGRLDLVAELTLPFTAPGGYLLAQKSQLQLPDELKAADKPISLLGGVVETVENLDESIMQRQLAVVCVKKIGATPADYPRSTSQLKKPLGACNL